MLFRSGSGVDLENLDFEAVDKEMEEDEAAQASAGVEPVEAERDEGGAAEA